jgi:alpha-galactosidase
LTDAGWSFADRRRTNAEIISSFYDTIRNAAGDAVVLGCNTVGHLAAGVVDAQRTGDDTSGRHWERTRRMGINTLAHRLVQHRRFFSLDADCVPCTPQVPWQLNRQFLDLVARSGTALFVSVDPRSRNDQTDADLAAALRIALDGGTPAEQVRAIDAPYATTPVDWRFGELERHYDWSEPYGGNPLPE